MVKSVKQCTYCVGITLLGKSEYMALLLGNSSEMTRLSIYIFLLGMYGNDWHLTTFYSTTFVLGPFGPLGTVCDQFPFSRHPCTKRNIGLTNATRHLYFIFYIILFYIFVKFPLSYQSRFTVYLFTDSPGAVIMKP